MNQTQKTTPATAEEGPAMRRFEDTAPTGDEDLTETVEAVEAEMRAALDGGWHFAGKRVEGWADRLAAALIETDEEGHRAS